MRNKSKLLHYFNILLVLLCMLAIFLFSCENAEKSTERSDTIINSIINVSSSENNITIDNTETGDITLVTIIRKGAHFLEFFLLGFLVVNLVKDYKKLNFKIVLLCVLFCMFYAVSDEVHQLFVDGRSCNFLDVIIDTCGSSVGALLYYFLYSNVNKTNVIRE